MNRLPPLARLFVALAACAAILALAWPPQVTRAVSWEDLLSPYAQGQALPGGYYLLPPRRGGEHDVVLVARRNPASDRAEARVQIHILERGRWHGVRESRSFGIAYETPQSPAPEADREAVTEAVAAAVRARDTGFESADIVPIRAEPPPPWLSRSLRSLSGLRGATVAVAWLALLWTLSAGRFGPWLVAALLGAAGAALRFAFLGLPFVRDQDVQRVLTGHGSWSDIAFGMGLSDRHPPLYFAVLHVVQHFGQAESVVRAPAALAGTLAGPAIIVVSWLLRRTVHATTLAVAFAVTISPALVASAREVSEIPLFALVLVAALAATAPPYAAVPRWRSALVGTSHATLLWLYYIAPLALAGMWIPRLLGRRPDRRIVRAAVAGLLGGLPALALLAVTLVRDYGARRVADDFPALAWGSRSPVSMLRELGSITSETFGVPQLLAWTLVVAIALYKTRDREVGAAIGALLMTALGLVLLTPIARLQPYYLLAVLPLLPLAAALGRESGDRALDRIRHGAVVASAAWFFAAQAPSLASAYLTPTEAFMPRFADAIAVRPERTIVTIAHYDATLLHYYLCRRAGQAADWAAIGPDGTFATEPGGKVVVPLVMAHSLQSTAGRNAAQRLREMLAERDVLVVDRTSFQLPELASMLAGCAVLDDAPSARLLSCGTHASGPR